MTTAATHPYIESLLTGYEARVGVNEGGAAWLNERRAQALERANALAVPTPRDEEWRFTDIAPLTKTAFRVPAAPAIVTMADVSRFIAPEATAHLVFVDGVYVPGLSASAGLPYGVVVTNLAAALSTHATVMEPRLARLAGFEREVFTAVNTAHLRDGSFIWIAKDQKCPTPVQVLHVATRKDAVWYPRCLVVAEAGAECTLIEDYASLGEAAYFTNAVTEIAVGEGARVRHVRIQREAAGAFHIAHCAATVGRDAHYASHAVTLGGRISRLSLEVLQQGEGAAVTMDGLALIKGRQLADTHTLMDHARPNGSCNQSHKCIVGGAAHAVFNGKIIVRPGAQLTNSAQQSRNLLTHAFAAELIDRIPVPSLVEQLEETVLSETGVPA